MSCFIFNTEYETVVSKTAEIQVNGSLVLIVVLHYDVRELVRPLLAENVKALQCIISVYQCFHEEGGVHVD